jgi:integrase
MASVHKDPRGKSPFWYAAFYGADGTRKFRSTKTSNRKEALEMSVAWEQSAKKARSGSLTAAQARKVLAEMVLISSGEALTNYTVQGWLNEWLKNKAGGSSENTMLRYRQVIRDFLAGMGIRAKSSLVGVTPGDIVTFRDTLRQNGRAVSTCNVVVKKILSVPFEAARKLGYIPTNPVAAVDVLKDKVEERKSGREPFTQDEVAGLVSAAGAESDWHGAIILAATTGLRLGDVVNLTWGAIDKETGLLHVETEKTGVAVTLPAHPDFVEWLEKRTRGIGKAPVFPALSGKNIGGNRGLSSQFRDIIVAAKITGRVVEKHGKKGRTRNSKGFHSLRHTFVSGLANAGVAADIRQKLAGHADAKVHAGYTHHEMETLRGAVAKLPRLATKK